MAWNLGALNGRKRFGSSWSSLEIRTDARGLPYLAVYSLVSPSRPAALRGALGNNVNVSGGTASEEAFTF